MNTNEIISIAHAAGLDGSDASITLFAERIAEITRKQCAQVVEEEVYDYWDTDVRKALVNAAYAITHQVTA